MERKWNSKRKSGSIGVFAAVCAVICLGVVFGGCGNDSDTPDTTPEAKPGSNQTVTLSSTLTVTLDGSASVGASSYAWVCVSYTANKGAVATEYTAAQVTGLLSNAGAATTTVDLRKAGTYVFRLTLNGDVSTAKEVTVNVQAQVLTKTSYSIPAIDGVTTPVSSFSFVQSYNPPTGGWDTDFPSALLTYTLTAEGVSSSDTTSSISPIGRANNEQYLVTQIFYYNGVLLGNRSIVLGTGTGNFNASLKAKNDFSDVNAPVPALNDLTLRVEKTEL